MLLSDTKHERNYLMEKAYPKLKSFCKQLGYEFQVCVFVHFLSLFKIEAQDNIVCAPLSIIRCSTLN